MKPQMVSNHAVKALSVIATVAVLFVSNPLSAHAGPIKEKKIAVVSDDQVNVQYKGSDDNSFVFQVVFENPTARKFSLILKNDEGLVVYAEQFNDSHFTKTIRVEKEGKDIHPTFIIRTGNQELTRKFAVNRVITEHVEVTKL
ncbi:MAG TPA: hypothetical protein VFV08_01895 [Puia sp.]|nr:hypothetical protein [Puia sp.]